MYGSSVVISFLDHEPATWCYRYLETGFHEDYSCPLAALSDSRVGHFALYFCPSHTCMQLRTLKRPPVYSADLYPPTGNQVVASWDLFTSKHGLKSTSAARWSRRSGGLSISDELDHASRATGASSPFWRKSGLPDNDFSERRASGLYSTVHRDINKIK